MGRHNRSISTQLHDRINSQLRIGQKKTKESSKDENGNKREYYNPNRSEGIHSIKTVEAYRGTATRLAAYCKEHGIRDIGNINKEAVAGYMSQYEGKSAWTASREVSAINKILDTHYTPREFGFQTRNHEDITNNRGKSERSTAENPRNADALHFAYATGCRRASITTATPEQAIRNETGTIVGFTFTEKGGRERNALVLPSERGWITEFVNHAASAIGEDKPMIAVCDANCNPHFQRGEYAQQLYQDMLQAKQNGTDIYEGMRSTFINQERYEHAIEHPRYREEFVRGYDTHICAELSQQLGHNRIEVVINSYLDK